MRRQGGMTIMELMVAVAIVGVLAAVAVFMFTKTTKKAKADAEVNAMFTELRLRQEAYHVENGAYLSTGADESDAFPASPSGPSGGTEIQPMPATWTALRLRPGRDTVLCTYVSMAGDGGDDTNLGAVAQSFGMDSAPATNWYYLLAECDMDGNSSVNSFYFSRSDTTGVAKRNEGR